MSESFVMSKCGGRHICSPFAVLFFFFFFFFFFWLTPEPLPGSREVFLQIQELRVKGVKGQVPRSSGWPVSVVVPAGVDSALAFLRALLHCAGP